MTAIEPRCEGCGAPLLAADAVCSHCEAELTAEPPGPPAKYICPHCQDRFAAPARLLWPPKVPWWRPTTFRNQCPHCDAPLHDRRDLPFLGWIWLTALGLMLYLQEFAGSHRTFMRVALVLLLAFCGWQAWRDWKGERDPHRFVAGIRRRWLRQLKELTPAKRPRSEDPLR